MPTAQYFNMKVKTKPEPKDKASSRNSSHVARRNAPAIAVEAEFAMKPGLESAPTRIKLTLLSLCLLGAAFAVYSRTMKNPFVNYDDQGYVVENQHIQHGLTVGMLRWALTSTDAHNWHPLTWISHALDVQLFGLTPAGHHSTNFVLHGLNAVLLFLLLARATGAIGRSFMVAAIFALHPVNVESVAWIAERKNVLSMLFFLLGVGAYAWYAKRPGIWRYLPLVILFAMGLASKPMIVTLPFVLLLLDFWPLQRVEGLPTSEVLGVSQSSFRILALEKLPLLALSAASSIMTVFAQRDVVADSASLPVWARLLNAAHAYSEYVVAAFWPVRLAAFYPYKALSVTSAGFLFSFVLLVAISVWVLRERKRVYLAVGWFWFLGTLVPVIGLVQVGEQSRADRYAYIPLIGIFWMIVWLIGDYRRSGSLNLRLKQAASVAVLVVLSVLTWRQIGFWHSSYELWAHALQVTADNYRAEDYVGSALLVRAYESSGQRYSEEATEHFRNAVRINPQDPIGHLNVGAYLHERGQLNDAVQEYRAVLQLTPDLHLRTKALIGLGAAHQQLGDHSTARQYYTEVLKLEPGNTAVFLSMGRLGMEQRIQELITAASRHPSSDAYLQLGQLQEAAGHNKDARSSFEAAVKLNPKSANAKSALDRASSVDSKKHWSSTSEIVSVNIAPRPE